MTSNRAAILLSFLFCFLFTPAYAQEAPPAESLLKEGIDLFKAGKFDEAIKPLKEFSALAPDNHLPYYYIGFSYFRLGDRESAKEALKKSTELKADFVPAHMGLGVIYEVEGILDSAKKEYEAAVSAAKEPDEAKIARDRLSRIAKILSAEHLRKTHLLVEEGKVEEAIKELLPAAELTPENIVIPLLLGSLYVRVEKPGEATTAYRKAKEIAPENPDIRMRLAELYLSGSAYKEAMEELNEVIRLAPGTGMAEEASRKITEAENRLKTRGYFEEAARAIREERLDDALTATQEVLEIEPRNSFAYFNLGVVYNRKKMYEDAIIALKKAIELSPKYVEAHYQLGVVYDDMGRYGEALKAYEAAAGGREDVEETKKTADRMKILRELVMSTEVTERVKILLDAGDLDGALREAEKIVALNEDEKNLYTLGQIYFLRNEFDRAIETLGRVIKINPQNWDAYFLLGQSYEGKRLYREAEINYSKVVSAIPDTGVGKEAELILKQVQVKIHFEKAREYKAKGDMEGALREVQLILEVAPDDPIAMYNAGVLYYTLENPERAVLYLTRVIEKKPDYIQAHLQLAIVYEYLRRYDEAEAEFKAILSLAKEGREVDIAKSRLGLLEKEEVFSTLMRAAQQLIREGKYEMALSNAETVITIAPGNYIAHYTIGFIYERLDMLNEAKAAFRKAIEINPEYAKAHFGLAKVYEREGLYEDAREAYRKTMSAGEGTREAEMAAISLERLKKWRLTASKSDTVNNIVSYNGEKSTGTASAYGASLSYDMYSTREKRLNINNILNYNIYYETQFTGMEYGADVTWNDRFRVNHTYALSTGYRYGIFDNKPSYENYKYSLNMNLTPDAIPTSLSLRYDYSSMRSFVSAVRNVDQHTVSMSTSQRVSKWDSLSGTYSFVSYFNKDPIGSNFAYRSDGLSLVYTKTLLQALSVNSGYSVNLKNYMNPDSTTLFRRFRRNVSNSINAGVSYRLSEKSRFSLEGRSAWEVTNIPALKAEDLVALGERLADPIPRLGGWNKREDMTVSGDINYMLFEKGYFSLRFSYTWADTEPEKAGSYRKLNAGMSVVTVF